MHNKTLFLLLTAAVVFDFTGCSSMSAQARRERAYRHYVQKQMKQRRKAMARAQKEANREMKAKMKSIQPSDPRVTTSVESAPDFANQPMSLSDSQSDQIAAPITVSASAPMPTAPESGPDQP